MNIYRNPVHFLSIFLCTSFFFLHGSAKPPYSLVESIYKMTASAEEQKQNKDSQTIKALVRGKGYYGCTFPECRYVDRILTNMRIHLTKHVPTPTYTALEKAYLGSTDSQEKEGEKPAFIKGHINDAIFYGCTTCCCFVTAREAKLKNHIEKHTRTTVPTRRKLDVNHPLPTYQALEKLYRSCSSDEKKEDPLPPYIQARVDTITYFGCTACSQYVATKKDHIESHLTHKHSEERPFHCSRVNCIESFKTTFALESHLTTHAKKDLAKSESLPSLEKKEEAFLALSAVFKKKEKKYFCAEVDCPKHTNGFLYPSDLERHLAATHRGERPFCCPEADCTSRVKSFYDAQTLKGHCKIFHNEDAALPVIAAVKAKKALAEKQRSDTTVQEADDSAHAPLQDTQSVKRKTPPAALPLLKRPFGGKQLQAIEPAAPWEDDSEEEYQPSSSDEESMDDDDNGDVF